MEEYLTGLDSGWGPLALDTLRASQKEEQQQEQERFRVVTVRHGMGHHNDAGGALSVFNRDATLNDIGHQQAHKSGEALQAVGFLPRLDLIVVSPFTRTLETAVGILGGYCRPKLRTIVHPLAAEHTLQR